MPNPFSPHPVSGVVYDTDSSTVLSGATVTAINVTTSEASAETFTTSSNGQYLLDLANFQTSGWTSGDKVILRATKGDKISETLITVSGIVQSQNLIMTYYDVCTLIRDLLTGNWQSGRTDLNTPTTVVGYDKKMTDNSGFLNVDSIHIYDKGTINQANSIGALTKKMDFNASIDIRSTYSRMRLMKLKHEVERILGTNILTTIYGYDIIDPDANYTDLSDGTRNFWRLVMDVKVQKLNATRASIWSV